MSEVPLYRWRSHRSSNSRPETVHTKGCSLLALKNTVEAGTTLHTAHRRARRSACALCSASPAASRRQRPPRCAFIPKPTQNHSIKLMIGCVKSLLQSLRCAVPSCTRVCGPSRAFASVLSTLQRMCAVLRISSCLSSSNDPPVPRIFRVS